MAINLQELVLRELIKEFQRAPGETVEERTNFVLSQNGWDKELDGLSDRFRVAVRAGLEHLALHRAHSQRTAKEIEEDKYRKETDRIAASGMCGNLFADQLAGLDNNQLAKKYPRETYWLDGQEIPREALAFNLKAVAELRKRAFLELVKNDKRSDVYRDEITISDELLRRGREASKSRIASADDATHQI